MTVRIGTSGWHYGHWRERFYPPGMPQREWLAHYARRFSAVESNNAFYRLPEARTFRTWAESTPEDFVFAVKVSRYLTHMKRLREATEPVERFVDRVSNLGSKLGPVLLQLPPTLKADLEALEDTLGRFPPAMRVAVEFRHPSWFGDETRALLEEKGAALCLADGELSGRRRRSIPVAPLWRTAQWGYLRMHHGAARPDPCYGSTAVSSWAQRLAALWGSGADLFVFFNNDGLACALRDAVRFARAAHKAGLAPARTPDGNEISVG